MTKLFGKTIDKEGRCIHYHTVNDIVALKCSYCERYYACFHCHDECENHKFKPTTLEEAIPVLCGKCRNYLTLN
ncbi:hypothetical protein HMPREF9318_01001 [Streptococcus urinalis FB127-CNA-2]|nr:hypothetical protein HMPREF9318_01001 [Streptococcus urinalis FB127-CNA-2]VEF31056.1 BioY family protein [Streptococcus urinalis]